MSKAYMPLWGHRRKKRKSIIKRTPKPDPKEIEARERWLEEDLKKQELLRQQEETVEKIIAMGSKKAAEKMGFESRLKVAFDAGLVTSTGSLIAEKPSWDSILNSHLIEIYPGLEKKYGNVLVRHLVPRKFLRQLERKGRKAARSPRKGKSKRRAAVRSEAKMKKVSARVPEEKERLTMEKRVSPEQVMTYLDLTRSEYYEDPDYWQKLYRRRFG